MADEKEPAHDKATVADRVVMPSLYDLRGHARSMLEAADEIALAKAIQNGDRIDSYQSYVEWLRAGRNGDVYVQQAIETMLFDLFDNTDKKALAVVIRKATQYMLDL